MDQKILNLSDLKGWGKYICPILIMIFGYVNLYGQQLPDISKDDMAKYEKFLDSATNAAEKENWKEAEAYTIKALKLRPADKSNWLLWANLGEIRNKLEDYEGALDAFDIGLANNAESIKMLSGRSFALINLNKIQEAILDLNSALRIDETLEWERIMLGFLYMREGDLNGAEEEFTILLEIYPDNMEGHYSIGRINAAEGKSDEAIKHWDVCLANKPSEEVYVAKIVTLIENDKLSAASETISEAMKHFPRRGNLFLMRSYVHKKSFRNAEMEIDLKLAKEYGADDDLINYVVNAR